MYLMLPLCFLAARRGAAALVSRCGRARRRVRRDRASDRAGRRSRRRCSGSAYSSSDRASSPASSRTTSSGAGRNRDSRHGRCCRSWFSSVSISPFRWCNTIGRSRGSARSRIGSVLPYLRNPSPSAVTQWSHTICTYSYGIYLFHVPVLWLAIVRLSGAPMAARIAVGVGGCIILPVARLPSDRETWNRPRAHHQRAAGPRRGNGISGLTGRGRVAQLAHPITGRYYPSS